VSKLKANQLRNLTDAELEKQLNDLKEEYFNLRFQLATGQLSSSANIKLTKRDIARVKTILREREIAAAK
jgi:large subunit ribosomal protein L29